LEEIKLKKIAVVMPHWLGDAIMALPAMRYLRKLYPKAHITVVTIKSLEDLYSQETTIDACLSWNKSKGLGKILSYLQLTSQLRAENLEMGVLFTNSFASALILKGTGISYRVGYAKEQRGFLLSHSVPFPQTHRKQHQSLQFLNLLFSLWDKEELADTSTHLLVSKHDRQKARRAMKSWGETGYVGLGIFSAFGPAKDWSAERYRFLGESLYKMHGLRSVLFGTEKDQSKANFIHRGLEHIFVDLTGQTTMSELKALLAECRLYIGNDSGLSHLAAALNIPTIVIFGSTFPEFTRPLGRRVEVLYAKLACSPCFERVCPLGTLQCMRDIRVDDVMDAVEEYV
jgi:heptosyltransferase-2